MTVTELIAKLQTMPGELPVYRHDGEYGDIEVNDENDVRLRDPERVGRHDLPTRVVIG